MTSVASNASQLRDRINLLETQLEETRQALLLKVQSESHLEILDDSSDALHEPESNSRWPLAAAEYRRYSRQLIVPQIGLAGQLKLRNASVLVVGIGGLGCPAAQYLAGAGIGTLGLVDGDTVDLSNIHRQILHFTQRLGVSKVESATETLRQINPSVRYMKYPEHLSPQNALAIFKKYDLILDCTDRPASRYLISDAAVISRKPVVSASALRTEGQLLLLNHNDGPCYRCVFPKPPPAESVLSCGDGGILGPVVGVMGVLQAQEAIKVITSTTKDTFVASSVDSDSNSTSSMLLYSSYSNPLFRQVRIRGKRSTCPACSPAPSINADSLSSGSLDYDEFCGLLKPIDILQSSQRISTSALQAALHPDASLPCFLLDVRDETQFQLCNIPGSTNVPYSAIEDWRLSDGNSTIVPHAYEAVLQKLKSGTTPIYVMCRFGNDSQLAVRALMALKLDQEGKRKIQDVQGGFRAWRDQIDPTWPEY